MAENHYTVVLTPDQDIEGSWFAYFIWDPETRGAGSTQMSAILSLVLVTAENYEEDISEQAPDLIGMTCIENQAIEKALEKRYGGTIKYVP